MDREWECISSMTQMVMTAANWLQFDGLRRFVENYIRRMQARQLRRTTINELYRLTDADLNDIGLSRGDIWSVANGNYWKDASDEMRLRNNKPVAPKNDNLEGWV